MWSHCRQGLPLRLACILAFIWFGLSPSLAAAVAKLFPRGETTNLGQWGDQSSGEVQLGLWSPDADVETETPRGEWPAFCHWWGTRYGTKCHRLWPAWPHALPCHPRTLSFGPSVTCHLPGCQELVLEFHPGALNNLLVGNVWREEEEMERRKERREEIHLLNNS